MSELNSAYLERIADEWRERASELAEWSYAHLVNRTDVWGRYLKKKAPGTPTSDFAAQNNAVTAPFRDERGKVFLNVSSLEKHFKAKSSGQILGVHSVASDATSRWMALDIDLHDEDDLSVSREGNFVAARGWMEKLQQLGLDPLLMDSNGNGGFHLWVIFAEPMYCRSVHQFLEQLTADYARKGLDAAPEFFPGAYHRGHYGNWLRLPGRHHSRSHYTRIFNDEPWADTTWLEGHDAIDRMLRTQLASTQLLESLGIERSEKTICLDFDGVIHAYTSPWQGVAVIPDPPIHRVDEAIVRLRKRYRVVVHSSRCCSADGITAIQNWLAKHNIEVDEVCQHKPPAMVYVDDRAIRFTGDWDETMSAINDFRK
jgi:hypothetical protein